MSTRELQAVIVFFGLLVGLTLASFVFVEMTKAQAIERGLRAIGEGIAEQNVRSIDRQYEIFQEQKKAMANELQELRREPRQQ